MFDNINNKHYSQSLQSCAKRDHFRLEIRRRAIEQFKTKVRTQCLTNSEMHFHSGKQQQKQWGNDNLPDKKILEQNANQIRVVSGTCEHILETLEQLSLTQPSQLCRCQNLHLILNFLSNASNFIHIQGHLSKVLIKICINQIYWTQDLLALLFVVLFKMIQFGADCSQYLINLSECAEVQFKAQIYGLIIGSGIFESQISNRKPKQHYNKLTKLRILSNFLLVAPMVSHTHPYLHHHRQKNKSYFLQRLIKLLSCIISIVNENTSKKLRNKQNSMVLQLFHGMCSRFESQQLSLVLNYLHNSKWQFFSSLVAHIGLQANIQLSVKSQQYYVDLYSRPMEVKIKYKLLQCVQVILKYCISGLDFKQIGLSFMYQFLPTIMTIIVNDSALKCRLDGVQLSKYSKQFYSNQLESRYQLLMLQVIYTLINVKDQLNDIPVLQYISVTHPALFQTIYNNFGNQQQSQPNKIKLLAWIFEVLNAEVKNICELEWANKFAYDIIMNYQMQSQQSALTSVLETIEYILINEDHNSCECKMKLTMKDGQVKARLENIAVDNRTNRKEIVQLIESIFDIIEKD